MSGTCPKVQAIWLEVKATVPSESIAMVFELDCVAKGPFVNQILPDASGTVGQEIQQQIPEETIQDPDGKPVAYAVSLMDGGQLPEWLHFDPETETLSGTPSAAQELHLLVEGKDEQGLTAQTSWKLKVGPSGPAPKAKAQPLVAQHLPLWEGTVGEKMVRQVPEGVVSDPLGSQLHFSAHGEHGTLPHWMSFDPKSMTFSGVPDKALSMTVYVKGATKEGLSARSRMKVVVGTPSVNKLAKEMTAVAEEDKLIVPTLPPPEQLGCHVRAHRYEHVRRRQWCEDGGRLYAAMPEHEDVRSLYLFLPLEAVPLQLLYGHAADGTHWLCGRRGVVRAKPGTSRGIRHGGDQEGVCRGRVRHAALWCSRLNLHTFEPFREDEQLQR
ncbi:unnamed protein product [Durusdinium trenchii]